MKNQKNLAFILTIAMIISTFISCGKKPSETNTDTSSPTMDSSTNPDITSESETTANLLVEMGEKNFNGVDYKILTFNENLYMHNYVEREELTGEVINDSVFERNAIIEEKYGINIKMIEDDDAAGKIKSSVSAGDKAYDISYMRLSGAPALMTGGFLTDLYKIPSLSLESGWWLQNSVKSLSVSNKLYYANSYANMAFSDLCWTMFYNKKFVEDYKLENPYKMVEDGTWTFEKFEKMLANVTHDVDGDGALKSSTDTYGIITHTGTVSGLMIGADAQLVLKDDKDLPYLTSSSSTNERLIEIMMRVGRIYNSDNFAPLTYPDISEWAEVFFSGNSLFYAECLGYYPTLREQDITIGLLPFPKYDENQKEYHNYLITPTVVCIPSDSEDIDRTGFILEALSRESYQGGLYNAYFETTLGTKLINDSESKNILKTIIDSCTYDLSELYGVNTVLSNLGSNGGKLTSDKYENVASSMAKLEKSQKKTLEKLINNVNELK